MLNKRTLAIFITIFSLASIAFADVAPEPGYVRVAAPLAIEPQDDFKGYRFFLDSPGGFEEIKLAKGKTTTISSEGRAGTMRFTTLIAIPSSSMAPFDGPATPEKMDALQKAVGEKTVEGVIELVSHTFDAYVKKRQARSFKSPKYLLKTSADKKIEAVEVKQGPGKKKTGELDGAGDGNSHLAATIIGGGLMSLGFIFGGVWFTRRRQQGPVRK